MTAPLAFLLELPPTTNPLVVGADLVVDRRTLATGTRIELLLDEPDIDLALAEGHLCVRRDGNLWLCGSLRPYLCLDLELAQLLPPRTTLHAEISVPRLSGRGGALLLVIAGFVQTTERRHLRLVH